MPPKLVEANSQVFRQKAKTDSNVRQTHVPHQANASDRRLTRAPRLMFLSLAEDAAGVAPSEPTIAPPPPDAPPEDPPPFLPFMMADDDVTAIEAMDMDRGESAEGGAAAVSRKRQRHGTFENRWMQRLLKSNIMADIAAGCAHGCGCVDRLSYASVFHARTERSQEGLQGNRDWMRNFLAMNKDGTKRLGYNSHADESAETLCVTGFDVLNGFAPGYTYSRVREAKAGIVSDDPNRGGNRLGVGAGGSDAFNDDSLQSMAFRGWFSELRADPKLMPNVNNKNERHIDFIEVSELFAECVADLEDSGTPKEAIGTQVCVRARACHSDPPMCHSVRHSQKQWRAIWKGEFSDLRIREHKAVDGKDRKRAELRRLLRRTVTRCKATRDIIKELRALYRDSLRRERTYYWHARLLPPKYPLLYMTYIQDGATQT